MKKKRLKLISELVENGWDIEIYHSTIFFDGIRSDRRKSVDIIDWRAIKNGKERRSDYEGFKTAKLAVQNLRETLS